MYDTRSLYGSCALILSAPIPLSSSFFFFNDTATTEIYTLSLHDALPICLTVRHMLSERSANCTSACSPQRKARRSEEHTSELQSPDHLVCRLLLEKKKPYLGSAELAIARCGRTLSPPAPHWSLGSRPSAF